MTLNFAPGNTSLASRRAAALDRTKVSAALLSGTPVAVDFSKVESISGSYADEFFGMLVVEVGLEKVRSNLRILGAQPYHLEVIAEAMITRQHQLNQIQNAA